MKTKQWSWMMNYCKNEGFPPAEQWAWGKARNAYEKFILGGGI